MQRLRHRKTRASAFEVSQHPCAGPLVFLRMVILAVMLQELNLVARPNPEAIAQLLGQRYLPLGTQNGHRCALAKMTKS